ncbi:acetylcholine receptor subunit beta-like [Aplysia californica]|uniref:Acetylcholine receptor subunit beta-like n=1 Tax=Aplysia californica TaxID=6500 RepID=A0ABM1VPR6_APLCA|nr:acetylcholine receptor subunit beta-like [Aplysia californica]
MNKPNLFRVILTLAIIERVQQSSGAGFRSVDDEVLEEIFSNYSSQSRPVVNVNETVEVNVYFGLLNILNVDSKSQSLELSAFINIQWTDGRLAWDTYNNARDKIWTPVIGLRNSLGPMQLDQTMFNQPSIHHSGKVYDVFAGVITTRYLLFELIMSLQ